jgi:hypothetical protein
MDETIDVFCPYCGEPSTISVTPGEEDEEFVQDCPVCCRPWKVRVRIRRDGSADVTVAPEGD